MTEQEILDVFKFTKVNGDYLDEDGCHYDSLQDIVTMDVLEFCGCGDPIAALKYVHDALILVDKSYNNDWKVTRGERDNFFNNSEGLEYFVWYYLSHLGLTEHGSSVPGWITAKGKAVIVTYELYKEEE